MGLFTRKKPNSFEDHPKLTQEIHIKQIKISNNKDFMVLRQNLLAGHIMICNLNPLFEITQQKSLNYQKNYQNLQLIKRYCIENGGSISKLQEHILIITPNHEVKIR